MSLSFSVCVGEYIFQYSFIAVVIADFVVVAAAAHASTIHSHPFFGPKNVYKPANVFDGSKQEIACWVQHEICLDECLLMTAMVAAAVTATAMSETYYGSFFSFLYSAFALPHSVSSRSLMHLRSCSLLSIHSMSVVLLYSFSHPCDTLRSECERRTFWSTKHYR